jgi:DNA-binding MarR family transcriptional regulator
MALKVLNFGAHKVPTFKEARGKDWILYGDDGEYKNRYPEYLLNLYRRSAKNHAIINSKKDYVVGQGWAVKSEGLDTMRLARLQQFMNEPNQYESLNDILEKVALDYELYNGFALEIVYNQLNDKIAAIYHADFARYRSNEDGTCYYYSEDWSKHQPVIEKIDAFNWKEPSGKQLLYVKGYSPDCKYYPLPTYLGSTAYVELDVEIANFHLNSVKNNFVGGTIVSFYNGEPTQEEQEEIERQIKSKFTGTDNANSIVLNFADSKDRGVEIQQLNGNDFDKRFDILNKTVQREIYAGHQVTDPALFGIKEDGIFTSRNQLVDSFELFQNTYVNGRQQFIERVFNELAALQGLSNCLYIKDTEPISIQFSEATVTSVMTEEEIREKVGLEVVEAEEDAGVDSKTKDAQAALKGSVGGVSGIITLLQNVKEGLIATESAISVLTELYGFTPEIARATVTGEEIPETVAAELRSVFSKEEEDQTLIDYFSSCGSTDYEPVGEGKPLNFESETGADLHEELNRKYWFAEVDPIDTAILSILEENPSTPFTAIAKQLELSIERVIAGLQRLNEANAIKLAVEEVLDSSQRVVEVTKEGKKLLEEIPPVEEEFVVRYVYSLRPEAKGTSKEKEVAGTDGFLIDTSRRFCRDMYAQVQAGKSWKLTEIQNLGVSQNRNVWMRGGGFWGKSYHCRHYWEQKLMRVKK